MASFQRGRRRPRGRGRPPLHRHGPPTQGGGRIWQQVQSQGRLRRIEQLARLECSAGPGGCPSMPKRVAVFILVTLSCIAADQASKAWARSSLGPRESQVTKKVVPGAVELRLSYNHGAAFSTGDGNAAA